MIQRNYSAREVRMKRKREKGSQAQSREIDDVSDNESIMPLVRGETKEKYPEYSYADKGSNV